MSDTEFSDEFADALCRSYHSDLWFPPAFDEHPTGTDSEYFEVAKMVCSVCMCRTACLEAGREEKFGMWGGATPSERRRGINRPSKRLANRAALELLPKFGDPQPVEIGPLRKSVQDVTRRRPKP